MPRLIVDLLQNGLITPDGVSTFSTFVLSAVVAKAFFAFLKKENESLPSDIKVVVSGSHLTAKWRDVIKDEFKLEFTQEYGLTEFSQGNAWLCGNCNSFHFPIY